jgi:outer membrane lipoprotein-sorting protein
MTILALTAVLTTQISAGAIVARVKEGELAIKDLTATVHMQIVKGTETKSRRFRLRFLREGVDYRILIRLQEPKTMAGTAFLVDAERGKRNQQWAYFPDLDLVRSIPGKSQDDPFLGSDITYADLAGGAHLDDMLHTLEGEETIGGDLCYVMEGIPRHDVVYGKLRGWVRESDFVTVKAQFFDREGNLMKEAILSDIRELGEGLRFAHRIEMTRASGESKTVMTFEDVEVNRGLSPDDFTEAALSRK